MTKNWILRYVFFFTGLILFGLGIALSVKVKYLGLHPWDVLNIALTSKYGLTIGTWSVLCGFVLVGVSLLVDRRYVNIGTILNALTIGPFTDFFLWTDWLPSPTNTWVDYFILLSGIVITATGGGIYVAAGVGAGPRDGFMLSISDKTGLSVSRARIIVETLVLVIGYFLGGPVFIVTFIYTFIQSPIFQLSLKWFRKAIEFLEQKKSDADQAKEAIF